MRMNRYAAQACVILLMLPVLATAQKRAMTFEDVMKFRAVRGPVLSDKGQWMAYEAAPDRGDGEVVARQVNGKTQFTIPRGTRPAIAANEQWLGAYLKPPAVEQEKKKKNGPRQGMVLLQLTTGKLDTFPDVQRFAFSSDGRWLAVHHYPEKLAKSEGAAVGSSDRPGKRRHGSRLVVRHLESGTTWEVSGVLSFAFDSTAQYLAYAVADTAQKRYGVYARRLSTPEPEEIAVREGLYQVASNLRWSHRSHVLAFVEAPEDSAGKTGPATLWLWNADGGETTMAADSSRVPDGWMIPLKNYVTWTKDDQRVFFGLRPRSEPDSVGQDSGGNDDVDLFDLQAILKKREVDVWHWNDPYINPHQKKLWKAMQDTTYTAVYHVDADRVVQLGDETLTRIFRSDNPNVVLGITDVPYRKEVTWVGRQFDAYVVDLQTGERRKVAERLRGSPVYLSPLGRYVAYYQHQHWHLYDVVSGRSRNLTEGMKVVFFDEDHDYPSPPPDYGLAGWTDGDSGVLIYDKYDIWQFPTGGGTPINLTDGRGRREQWIFRVHKFDREKIQFAQGESLLLLGYHDRQKHNGFFECTVGRPGVRRLLEEPRRFRLVARAKQADRILYTREDYNEFPDLWIADPDFKRREKLTTVNPQMQEFAWGTSELVEWRSLDGTPLQGVLIKPGNYQPGKRYPVIVYFYRFFSQRLHEFNQPVVNHRPCFPLYASNGYAIFLPDIRFEVGRPGHASVKCLVPGVQKLIDMGIADPDRIGLHGHSWSGYQTAFIVTQTDIFACAIAGAPVSNMTSAYSGIRWETGLARQFQYEETQSRIGGSLWEYPERYIANSPVFFADRIHTPLLIMFGDEDGAVPWYQGIELYLAMRRLGKDCIFLQYRGEPHHLQKYPNKLDYAIKMKEYFDHYLKGMPAPKWIAEGVPYEGK